MKQRKNKIDVISTKPPGGWTAKQGQRITLIDQETGNVFSGTVSLKQVRCGKRTCHRCPHRTYAYAQFRNGSKVSEKYLGVAR